MLTANDITANYAAIAGVRPLSGAAPAKCTERNAGDRCGRHAVAFDPNFDDYLCAGHLKLAAAEALTVDAWDNDGVRR